MRKSVLDIIPICLVLWAFWLLGVPQAIWGVLAEAAHKNAEARKELTNEQADTLLVEYTDYFASLQANCRGYMKRGTFVDSGAVAYATLVDASICIQDDKRVWSHAHIQSHLWQRFDIPSDIHDAAVSAFSRHWDGDQHARNNIFRKQHDEYRQTHLSPMDKNPITKEDVRRFFLNALGWLGRAYLIFLFVFLGQCICRALRGDTPYLDPRKPVSFLLYLPLYPWFWLRNIFGEGLMWSYSSYNSNSIFSKQDEKLREQFVRGEISLRELQRELAARGVTPKHSIIVTMMLFFISTFTPRVKAGTKAKVLVTLVQDDVKKVVDGGDDNKDNKDIVKSDDRSSDDDWQWTAIVPRLRDLNLQAGSHRLWWYLFVIPDPPVLTIFVVPRVFKLQPQYM